MTILSEVTLPEKYIPLFQLQLRKLFTTVNEGKEETAKEFRTKLTELEQKIENLEERYVEGKVKEELYEKFIIKYNVERKELLEELQPSPINASNLEKYIDFATDRVTKPALVWDHSNYKEKQRMQKMIFPEGIHYNKENDQPRTAKINPLFALVADLTGTSYKEETRPFETILKKSGLVIPLGLAKMGNNLTGGQFQKAK
ncbi:hypothetical protein [Chitinophaga sp. CF418]|uniref:hypothetical protein n=1 Tax=Chitinophaga sp. CF418 TaxID=1855287 RepID=UPI000918C68D|nr:hypothetical protein [Chitinophaga sp. CF418]SHN45591.1 hypothetical protein SAMN05216311_120123 [Chitinophaga sp. CF418]